MREIEYVVGAPEVDNIERAFQASRRVILVLTPEWLAGKLATFEEILLRSSDPSAERRSMLPLLLKPCELPRSVAALKLEISDFTVEKNWERQTKRLLRDIWDSIPVPFPTTEGNASNIQGWLRWLARYRIQIIRWVLVGLVGWLIGASIFQVAPFAPRQGWQAIGLPIRNLERLAHAGDVLLASTRTDFLGCNVTDTGDTGLWRSTDRGIRWNYVAVPELAFDRPGQGCVLAAISAFAHALALPRRLYAATSDAGLLRSDDAGEHWVIVGKESLPDARLAAVAVAPQPPYTVWVAAVSTGIFRWLEAGSNWQRIDGAETCRSGAPGEGNLPHDLRIGVVLATAYALYIGTDAGQGQPNPTAGIYRSRDGGDCWKRIDDGLGRYSYRALSDIPDIPDQLVVLAYDHFAVSDNDNHQLWVLEGDQRGAPVLWSSEHTTQRLYVDSSQPARWYVIDLLGEVFRGSVVTHGAEQLPTVRRCLLPPTCLTDLAADFEPGPPLIAANDRIYRLEQVSWRQWLWP